MRISDWSSDVCSSDLGAGMRAGQNSVTNHPLIFTHRLPSVQIHAIEQVNGFSPPGFLGTLQQRGPYPFKLIFFSFTGGNSSFNSFATKPSFDKDRKSTRLNSSH